MLAERNENFIKRLSDKIVTIHMSDYDFRNECQRLPYEGKIDRVKHITLLEDANYSEPFVYEVSFKTPPSITRPNLTYKDVYENYIACINKHLQRHSVFLIWRFATKMHIIRFRL